jgi:ABC-2 type transport system permease protein
LFVISAHKQIKVYQIFRKEITSYLSSAVAYVTIGLFLLVLGLFLWVFPDSSILDYGYAGLDSLFSIAPFLFMFLVPAITMRSLAEERKEGTFELLVTRPLTDVQIVLGKYLASVLLLLCALLPTLFYYFTVHALGTPQGNVDTGGVIGSYIGLFLLGSGFAAIGIFASAITKNQIIAFALAVFLCFFIFSGFDSLSGLLSLQDYSIQYLGITEHYQSVSRGVLDTRDLAYFIILAAVFIALTLLVLIRQRQKKINVKATGALIAGLIVLLILSKVSFTRIDFTKEKRYTISAISRNVMDSLTTPVRVTVFLKGDGFPAGMKRLQYATRDMLNDLQAYSHGKLQFDIVDPLKNLAENEQDTVIQNLKGRGIDPINLSVKTESGQSQKIIFPAAMVTANNIELPVGLLQTREGASDEEALNYSIQNLEYAFTSAIKKITAASRQRIGITEGHNELTDLQMYDARRVLTDGFDVGRVDLKLISMEGLKKIGLLIIPKPDLPFTELEKFKIDQYLMNGGRILWSLDQVSAELDSLRGHGGEQLAFPKKLNLDDQLFTYGVRVNYDLIADMNCAEIPITTGGAGGNPQIQMLHWLFYPLFLPMSKHPTVKNLEGIRSEFASTIDTIGIKNVSKTILLTSSPYNKTFNTPYMLSLQLLEQDPDPATFQSVPKTVGVLLEGSFKSTFLNRPVPEGFTGQIQPVAASKPTKMVVLSDGDIFKNQIAKNGTPYPLGFDHYTGTNYGNRNLLLNLADYLTGDARLIALRNKEIQLRLLNRARIKNEKLYWQVINTVGPLLLVLIFAIFQHYLRKRKYAH